MKGRTVSREDSWWWPRQLIESPERGAGGGEIWRQGADFTRFTRILVATDSLRQIRSDPGGFIDDPDELRRWVERRTSRTSGNDG